MKLKYLFSCLILLSGLTVIAQSVTIESNRLLLKNKLRFVKGTAKLEKSSDSAIKNIKDFLESKPFISTLRIEGHVADASGKNEQLSKERALVLSKALIKAGVDCKKLLAVGFSDTKPIVENNTAKGKTENTRMVLEIAALRNRPIGGMPLDGGGMVAGELCK